MATLTEQLLSDANRANVLRDAKILIDDEVASKGGLSGMAIKTAYKTVKKVKPALIEDVLDGLIDKFIDRLEPFYKDWDEGGRSGSFESCLVGKRNAVANALLGVTDDRAKVVANKTLKKAYSSLRPQGEKNVEAAIPGLGRVIDKYL